MTPAAFLADLRHRAVVLEADGAGLRYRAPKGVLTAADHAALRQHRDELLALIRLEATSPADPCLACDALAWFLASDWPTPGTSRWLCRTCLSRPAPSLHQAAARLTADEHGQLEAEAAAGDALARVVVDTLAGAGTPALAADTA